MYLIYLLFFSSGAAGLIYQVVWSRLFNEVFGVTVYAVTTVLATFLAGLALGSVVLGRVADRRADPLRFYGWLEIGIALTGIFGTWFIKAVDPLHIWAANHFAPDAIALVAVRAILASIVILPPTFLMGGTLPVITRVFVTRIQRLGRELSFLYALNTLGAVLGTLAAGFVFIRLIGLYPTLWIAVVTNFLVGVFALLVAPWLGGRNEDSAPQSMAAVETEATPAISTLGRGEGRGLLLIMGLSGFVSMGLEVFWTRVLVMIVGTSTYAFVTMLSSFLVGIAIGGFIARLIMDRIANLRRAFGWIQVGIATSVLATLPVMGRVGATGEAQRWLGDLGDHWLALIMGRFGVSFLIMLVPTTLIGMTFPLAGQIWARQLGSLGGHLGQVYGANTLGNILGAVMSGFVVLPAVGLQKGIALLTILNLINAAWGLVPSPSATKRRPWLSTLPIGAAVIVGAVLLPLWQPRPFTLTSMDMGEHIRYYKEGVVATVMVVQDPRDPNKRWMSVDAIKIGQSFGGPDQKQQGLAHFPFILMPDRAPRKLLSIGLGTGILIGEAAKHESVESIECLEISPSVIEASHHFDDYSHDVLENPVARIINDDGVNFLKRTASTYDLIISDAKSKTAHAGNSLFFSQDYYELCRDHLGPDGLMIQWVPLDVPPSEMRIILHTFLSVFQYVYVLLDPPDSSYLIGRDQPLALDYDHMRRVLQDSSTANLRRYGWNDATDVVSFLVADHDSLKPLLAGETTINKLEHPVLEFYSPNAYAIPKARRKADNLNAFIMTRRDPLQNVSLANVTDEQQQEMEKNYESVRRLVEAMALLEPQDAASVPRAIQLIQDIAPNAPRDSLLRTKAAAACFKLAKALEEQGQLDEAIIRFRQVLQIEPNSAATHHRLGMIVGKRGQFNEAIAHYQMLLRIAPDWPNAHNNLGSALASQGRIQEAIVHFEKALRVSEHQSRYELMGTHLNLARALIATGDLTRGLRHYRLAIQLNPGTALMVELAWTLATHPDATQVDPTEAIRFAERAVKITQSQNPIALRTLAAAYASAGRFDDAMANAQRALAIAGTGEIADEIRRQLEAHRQGKTIRRSPRDETGAEVPAGTTTP